MEEYKFGNTEVAIREGERRDREPEAIAAMLRRAAVQVWRRAGEDPPEKDDGA